MISLEKRKKLLEKQKIETSRMELELKIEEKREDINRLQHNIELQNKRLEELDEEIANMS